MNVLVAGYLGWQPPVREIPITVDRAQEDAEFAAVMRDFDASNKQTIRVPDLTGEK